MALGSSGLTSKFKLVGGAGTSEMCDNTIKALIPYVHVNIASCEFFLVLLLMCALVNNFSVNSKTSEAAMGILEFHTQPRNSISISPPIHWPLCHRRGKPGHLCRQVVM